MGEPADLSALLAAAAAAAPDRLAVLDHSSTLTFAELDRHADKLASLLQECSSPGARVAWLSHSRADYVVGYYGVPRAHRVLLPLNPRLHPAEWRSQLRRARAEVLIGEADLLARLTDEDVVDGDLADLRVQLRLPAVGDTPPWARLPRMTSMTAPDPHATAWLLFTSGTTGPPKGVKLTHNNLLAAIATTAVRRPVTVDDVFLTPFPLCHVAGYSVLMHHRHRRPAVVMRRFDPVEFVQAVRLHGVTSVSLAPTMLDDLLEHLSQAPGDRALVRQQIRTVAYGASAISTPLLRRAMDELACEFNQGYGMTELAGNAVFLDGAAHHAALTTRPDLLGAAGTAGPSVEVKVVDEAGRDLPVGQSGDVLIRGPQVAIGYWEDPAADAEAFSGGWLVTGDVGQLDGDGVLRLVDRRKDIIITGGENVSSREVENVLRGCPGVAEVAVVGHPEPRWGQIVCAYVVRRPGAEVDADQLVTTSRAALAGFKTPRRIVFVDQLPKTETGKILKEALRRTSP